MDREIVSLALLSQTTEEFALPGVVAHVHHILNVLVNSPIVACAEVERVVLPICVVYVVWTTQVAWLPVRDVTKQIMLVMQVVPVVNLVLPITIVIKLALLAVVVELVDVAWHWKSGRSSKYFTMK